MSYQLSEDEKATLSVFKKNWDRANERHQQRCRKYDQRWETYLGQLKQLEGDWHSQLHPPYAGQYVETMLAMICDDEIRSTVLPETADDELGAKQLTKLLRIQRKKDSFAEQYYLWAKQLLIMGISPAKQDWVFEQRTIPMRKMERTFTGDIAYENTVKTVVKKNQPRFTPIPVHDFLWDPAARTIDDCQYVFHRTWKTLDSVKRLGKPGPNGEEPLYKNTEEVTAGESSYQGTPGGQFEKPDTRNRVEVVEYWTRTRLVTVANHSCILRDEPNPYWHGELPFVVASTMPDLFSMEGRSEVELVDDLQKALWEFLNQRIDNTKLMNNLVVFYREGSTDLEKFKIEPGAMIPMQDPAEIEYWNPNHNVVSSSLEAESAIKQDMQNITGAVEYISGSADGTIDQSTATGISIVQNMAQKRVIAKIKRLHLALTRKGMLEIALNQQFIDRPTTVRIDTENGNVGFETFSPENIQGNYDYAIENASESLNRQEKRQEALTLFTQFASLAPVLQQFGSPVNLRPFAEAVLEAFDKKALDRYFAQPGIPSLAPGMPPAPAGQPTPFSAPPGPPLAA